MKTKPTNSVLIVIAILSVSIFLMAACSADQTTPNSTPSAAMPALDAQDVDEMVVEDGNDAKNANDEAVEDNPQDKADGLEVAKLPPREIEIIARNWEFVPSTISINYGETVELHIKSVDVTHGFMVPELGINEQLRPNEDVHVTITADKRGEFPFFCNVPCGRGHRDMTGVILVE